MSRGDVNTFAMVSVALVPGNGRRPVTSSNSTAPSPHTSVRASTATAERICSGDMYAGVPISCCGSVIARSVVSVLEMPKSTTLTSAEPSRRRVTNRFDGLMSRCTMPAAWTSTSPSHACATSPAASAAGRLPRSWIRRARSNPASSSITMNGEPSAR